MFLFSDFDDNTCICNRTLADLNGNFQSYKFPQPYTNCLTDSLDMFCENTINAPAGSMVSLVINQLGIDPAHESLKVGTGQHQFIHEIYCDYAKIKCDYMRGILSVS